jgi:hypothetical protein
MSARDDTSLWLFADQLGPAAYGASMPTAMCRWWRRHRHFVRARRAVSSIESLAGLDAALEQDAARRRF